MSLCSICLLFFACNGPDTPLDADVRRRIDSLSNAEIRRARAEIDSLCTLREQTDMRHLVDSFKQIRLREIREQMKTLPQ